MGQTYSVYLNIRVKDEKKAAQALRDKIARAEQEKVQYYLEHYKDIGIGTDTLHDLLRIFFGGWEGKLRETHNGALESGFDASYGWEGVMMGAFDAIGPHLEDESTLDIWPDSGRDQAVVVDGQVQWLS